MNNRHALCVGALCIAVAHTAAAQSVERRVAAAPRGTVGFEYETRSNVCGDGSSIRISNDSSPGWTSRSRQSGVHIGTSSRGSRSDYGYDRCEMGPARVMIHRDGNTVVDVRVWVGARGAIADSDIGEVTPAEAAAYLLDLAPRLPGRAADNAVTGAEIARGVVVWPRLLTIARDNRASESSRKTSVFWLSHEASAAATSGLDSLAGDDDATLSVRSDALFFIAQRPGGEGVPALVKVAEGSRSMKLRKDAIWFLAQSRDPRALALFEKLLVGK